MGKASHGEREETQPKRDLQTGVPHSLNGHEKPATNKEWIDDEATDDDVTFLADFFAAVATDNVQLLAEIIEMLPRMKLTLQTVSIRDTDTNCVYSLLGVAKMCKAHQACAFLINQGLTQDYIDDEGIFN